MHDSGKKKRKEGKKIEQYKHDIEKNQQSVHGVTFEDMKHLNVLKIFA